MAVEKGVFKGLQGFIRGVCGCKGCALGLF